MPVIMSWRSMVRMLAIRGLAKYGVNACHTKPSEVWCEYENACHGKLNKVKEI